MKALVHAELLKLRSTRTSAGLLLATLGLVALTITVNVPTVGDQNAVVSLDAAGLLAGAVGISFGVPQVMAVLLGTLAFTQEFRYGTVTSTYLGEPRRTRVLAAKWLSLALSSLVITTATLALSVTFGIALIRSRDGNTTVGAQFWQMVAAGFTVMVAYSVIGVAVGALVRNQIAAVVGVLVWMLAVEQIVIPAFPAVGRWMPGGQCAVATRPGSRRRREAAESTVGIVARGQCGVESGCDLCYVVELAAGDVEGECEDRVMIAVRGLNVVDRQCCQRGGKTGGFVAIDERVTRDD